jgi:regulatory protein
VARGTYLYTSNRPCRLVDCQPLYNVSLLLGGLLLFYLARKPPKRLAQAELMDYALRALGSRAHSSGELRQKLSSRAADPADLDPVLLKLKEGGYLNDRRFAETFASSRLENGGLGRARVLRDLRQRRVAPKLAEQAVEQAFSGTDELALIDAFLKRKYRGKDLAAWLAHDKNLAGAYRRLRYAGYSGGASIRVLKQYAQRAGELEADELDGADAAPERGAGV